MFGSVTVLTLSSSVTVLTLSSRVDDGGTFDSLYSSLCSYTGL